MTNYVQSGDLDRLHGEHYSYGGIETYYGWDEGNSTGSYAYIAI